MADNEFIIYKKFYYFRFNGMDRRIGLNPDKTKQLLDMFNKNLFGFDMRKYPGACINEIQCNDSVRFTKCCGTGTDYTITVFPERFNCGSDSEKINCNSESIDDCHRNFINGDCKCSILNKIIGPCIFPDIYKSK